MVIMTHLFDTSGEPPWLIDGMTGEDGAPFGLGPPLHGGALRAIDRAIRTRGEGHLAALATEERSKISSNRHAGAWAFLA